MTEVSIQAKVDDLLVSPSSSARFFYRAYGLSFASAIELPELAEGEPGPVDAEIIWAATEPLDATAEEHADGLCVREQTAQFLVEGVARYTIEDGRRILIERLPPNPGQPYACEEDLRLFALGSAMGALLYQRDVLPLHASAVAAPQGTWAFTGVSGAGKSTLASWLGTHWGLPLVTDDVLAAHPQGDTFRLYPGPARAKLWIDTLAALGMSHVGLTRDYSRADKFHMRMRDIDPGPCPPLRGLVFLERGSDDEPPSLTAITGMEAFQAMRTALYRPTFAQRILSQGALFAHCMRLAKDVPCYRFRRRSSLADMDASLAPLLRQMGVSSTVPMETQVR